MSKPSPPKRRSTADETIARRPFALDLTLGVFLAALAALASPWLFGWVTIPWDAKAHFYPQLVFLAKSLHAGDSPFWNPHVFAGSPQIADPQSLIFSPFLLLALATPPVAPPPAIKDTLMARIDALEATRAGDVGRGALADARVAAQSPVPLRRGVDDVVPERAPSGQPRPSFTPAPYASTGSYTSTRYASRSAM